MSTFKKALHGGVHVVTASDGVQMVMLVRKTRVLFTDFIAAEAARQKYVLVINGSFIDLAFGTKLSVYATSGAIDPADATPTGQVVQEGKLLAGANSPGKFHFSQNTCGTEQFSAGLGNPPPSACSAVGGLAPIVIGGLAYGARNEFKPGAPAGAPATGDVPKAAQPFLRQKSNAMFSALLNGGDTVGKTALGFSSTTRRLTVAVQQHGASGVDADGMRSLFVGRGVDNAVFLDCSDSATMYFGGKFVVRPGPNKDEYLTVAVGFR